MEGASSKQSVTSSSSSSISYLSHLLHKSGLRFPVIEESEEMQKVFSILCNEQRRNEIVGLTLSSQSNSRIGHPPPAVLGEEESDDDYFFRISQANLTRKIRFIALYSEWNRTENKREKTRKGQKLIETFFSKHSQFRIEGIPVEYQRLSTSNSAYLEYAKRIILAELTLDSIVVNYIQSEQL